MVHDSAYDRRLAGVLTPRRDTAAAFVAAARHSRRVRLMRIVVPLIAVAVVLIPLLVSSLWSMLSVTVPLGEFGRLVMSGSKLTMEAPRLAGFTKDNRGYEVSAKNAHQDITQPNLIDLDEINARLALADDGWAKMVAKRGAFDAKSELLTLSEGILLTSSQGYEGRLVDAKVDVRAGVITSDKPVELNWLQGNLKAKGLEVRDNGQVMRFEGGVSMTVMLPQSQGTSTAGASSR